MYICSYGFVSYSTGMGNGLDMMFHFVDNRFHERFHWRAAYETCNGLRYDSWI